MRLGNQNINGDCDRILGQRFEVRLVSLAGWLKQFVAWVIFFLKLV